MLDNQPQYTITLDDDPMVSRLISKATGISSLPFTSGSALLRRSDSYSPVAVFIDVHLDVSDCGLDVIPHLRQLWPYTPILVVTSDENEDLVGQALALGANDFVRKPIKAPELIGRLRARIAEMCALQSNSIIAVGDLKFSRSKFTIECRDNAAYLPRLESELLATLVQNRNMVVSREELKIRLWGRIAVADNTLDKKISVVRQALKQIDSQLTVKTLYGQGVSLTSSESKTTANATPPGKDQ